MGSDQELVLRSQRKTVSTWVESLVGIPIPTACDYSFRSFLQDGSVLCKLMEALKPDSIPKGSDRCLSDSTNLQKVSYVENFFKAAENIGFPRENLFSVEELMGGEWDNCPSVVLCLYNLQRLSERLGLPSKQDQIKSGSVVSDQLDFPTLLHGIGRDGPNPPSFESSRTGIGKLLSNCAQILDDKRREQATTATPQINSFVPIHTPPIVPIAPDHFSAANGLNLVQTRLQEMIACVTSEQENRIRSDMCDREIFMKQLEEKVEQLSEKLTHAQIHLDQNSGMVPTSDMEVIESSAGQLAAKLEEYRKKNKELQENLEEERAVKMEIEEKYVEMKSKVESLDGVHTKYKEIQSENRNLYNMVQDLRGNIRVFCRIRPLGQTGDTSSSCIEMGSDGEMAVLGPASKGEKKKLFKFDKIFPMGATQKEVYAESQPLIRSVLDGYNVCIFAYGQTGSGKTHTMSGTNVEEYSGRGINYRALDDLFEIKANRSEEVGVFLVLGDSNRPICLLGFTQRGHMVVACIRYISGKAQHICALLKEVDFDIHVQMLEIYNEMLRDLLILDANKVNKLDIRSTEKSGLNVPDAVQVKVECTEDVLEVMEKGSMNRACSGTKMNDRSSRSHSVLTVVVDGFSRVTGVRTHGCLHLVDLAGSERIARSEATGDRLEEAKHINKSLSALGDVMSALASKSNHVPFRNSKLTQLLQDSLSGQAKAMMFMHIAPEASSMGETLSTSMFGSRVSQISLGQAQKNRESGKIFEAREAISKLRTSAQSKDDRIRELATVVETERAAAKTAMTEMQRMEAELKTLRDELSLTQRTPHVSARSIPTGGTSLERKPRNFPGRDPIDPPSGLSRRTNSIQEHPRGDMSARSTASRTSAVSARTAASNRSSALRPTVRSASSKPTFASDSKTAVSRPSIASTAIRKSVSDKDRANTRNVMASKAARRPATAGPQNPRRVALARTSTNKGGWL